MIDRNRYNEDHILKQYLKIAASNKSCHVLDVGCGDGRYLELIRQMGLEGLGVDINPLLVKSNSPSGLNCVTAEQFKETGGTYDVILMSHLIEHFRP